MSVDVLNPSRAYSSKVNSGKVADPNTPQTSNDEIADLLEKLKGLVQQEMTKALATQQGTATPPPQPAEPKALAAAQPPANAVEPPVPPTVTPPAPAAVKPPAMTSAKALFASSPPPPPQAKAGNASPSKPASTIAKPAAPKPAAASSPAAKPATSSGSLAVKPATAVHVAAVKPVDLHATAKPDAKPAARAVVVASSAKAVGGASNVNLSHFGMLQLPTGKPGSPDTITGSKLQGFSNSAFQKNSDGSYSLNVPKGGGVHTANSKYPRSELGENKTWNMNNGTSTLTSTMTVDKLPPSGTIVIGQIHQRTLVGGAPRPPIELAYKNGNIVAEVMDKNSPGYDRKEVVVAKNVPVGQKFTFDMKVNPGGKVDINVDVGGKDQSKSIQLDKSFGSSAMYFKTGNYCQDPQGGSSVRLYGAEISHT